MTDVSSHRSGLVYALSAYLLWGLFPLFWKLLHGVPALELVAHRVLWSLVLLVGLCLSLGLRRQFAPLASQPRLWLLHLCSMLLLATNWLTFVWSVLHDHVLEASLGYYLVPLANVLAGRLFFGETLGAGRRWAVGIASLGVCVSFLGVGGLPIVSVIIALSWGGYGVLRKHSPMGAASGLALETLYALPFALAYLLWEALHGRGEFGHASLAQHLLLVCTGLVTTLPLTLFAAGARRLKLGTLGFLQYLVPTMTFLQAVLIFGEPLRPASLLSLSLVWLALVLYAFVERGMVRSKAA